ncbi:MAG: penicillin acylase family protein [Acidobacteriota bacterium]
MKRLIFLISVAALAACAGEPAVHPDLAAWEARAANVTITRDDWGIAHVSGQSDADAVFGMIYAQAEDDFNRVETNYLNAMGRLAEAEGEQAIYRDLRMKLFISPEALKAHYAQSPEWLQELMDAWADGLNYYLHTHPAVAPRVITRFEPWMALSFTEGSIGGDIERVNLGQLEAFYGQTATPQTTASAVEPTPWIDEIDHTDGRVIDGEPTGSNGIAVGPVATTGGKALLLINPHTSFFFRAELQMASQEGLNAYGAVTWGQFFIYQGFNERTGWMHTSSGVDNIDEYLETVTKTGTDVSYRYGAESRPMTTRKIVVPYKTATGMAQKEFTIYATHHGPVVRQADDKWVSVRLMQEPIKALTQSYSRTKARDYKAFRESMELHTNSSNNTIYADADGSIAYFHSNFIPRRDPRVDWTRPVDGSDPATEWNGVLSIDESPNVLNPAGGWLYNANNHPWSAAGPDSPKKDNFPVYVERGGENARGIHAIKVLENRKDFTLDGLIATAYSPLMPAFETLIPALVRAWDRTPARNPLKAAIAEQVALLRTWDHRWAVDSVPTALGIYWAEETGSRLAAEARKAGLSADEFIAQKATPDQLLQALAAAADKLGADFGTWKTPWGTVNRFQRLTGALVQPFDDAQPSVPVGFTTGRWGSLASFSARTYPGTKKRYGTSGNSFVAVVEFGDRVRAKAVTAGGESGDPASKHFHDQAERYATGNLRDVYFYRDQLEGRIEREYRPGQ